jgi:hypothetical protein
MYLKLFNKKTFRGNIRLPKGELKDPLLGRRDLQALQEQKGSFAVSGRLY